MGCYSSAMGFFTLADPPDAGTWLFITAREDHLLAARVRLEGRRVFQIEGPAQLFADLPRRHSGAAIFTAALTGYMPDEAYEHFADAPAALAACHRWLGRYRDRGWLLVEYDVSNLGYHIDNAFIGADMAGGSPEIAHKIERIRRYEQERLEQDELRELLLDAIKLSSLRAVHGLIERNASVGPCSEGRHLVVAAGIGDPHIVGLLLETGLRQANDPPPPPAANLLMSPVERALMVLDDAWNPALHRAAENDRHKVVEMLLDFGVDKDRRDADGRSALCLAAGVGALDVVQVLVDRGARLELEAGDASALSAAADGGHDQVYDFLRPHCSAELVEHAAPRRAAGRLRKQRREALHPLAGHLLWASFRNHLDEIERLLAQGVPAGSCMPDGRTPLHEAARGGHARAVEKLLRAGAEIDVVDERGFTPWMRADGHADVQALLATPNDENG